MRILLLIIFINFLLVAQEVKFSDEQLQWIEKNNPIAYVGDPDWFPFETFDDKGNYIGLVADFLKYMQEVSPLKFKIIRTTSWAESIKVMESNKAIIMSQSKDFNKQTDQLFSRVYYDNPIVIAMDSRNRYVSSLYEIEDKKIAINSITSSLGRIKASYPSIKFNLVYSEKEGIEGVAYGKYDAFINSLAQTSRAISLLQLDNIRIVGKTEFSAKLGFGISKEHPELKSIVNKILLSMPANIQNKILTKWIHQDYIEKQNYTALYIAMGVFSFILGMGILFYNQVKKETKAKLKAQNKMLAQQSKMAAMGEMLDATAHQWKQPLNALSMYLELMENDFDDGLVDKAYLKEFEDGMHSQITHMTETLTEFRNFFRPNANVEDFNLLDTVNSVLLLTKDEFLKNNIALHVEIDKSMLLRGNANEFKHLIINLINNSKDAFNENKINKRFINIRGFEKENSSYIEIEDNAGGIPPNVIANIFQANFTTKEEGKGTGIGLYMSSQIVKKMGGNIKVSSTKMNSVFKITIERVNSQ